MFWLSWDQLCQCCVLGVHFLLVVGAALLSLCVVTGLQDRKRSRKKTCKKSVCSGERWWQCSFRGLLFPLDKPGKFCTGDDNGWMRLPTRVGSGLQGSPAVGSGMLSCRAGPCSAASPCSAFLPRDCLMSPLSYLDGALDVH